MTKGTRTFLMLVPHNDKNEKRKRKKEKEFHVKVSRMQIPNAFPFMPSIHLSLSLFPKLLHFTNEWIPTLFLYVKLFVSLSSFIYSISLIERLRLSSFFSCQRFRCISIFFFWNVSGMRDCIGGLFDLVVGLPIALNDWLRYLKPYLFQNDVHNSFHLTRRP